MSSHGEEERGDIAVAADGADVGLLSPVLAGTAAERLTSDSAVVTAMVRTEAALLRALVRCELAPGTAMETADTLEAQSPDPRALALAAGTGGNPVIPLVRELRSAVPEEEAGWVHHGATSQDILDTALMLVSRDTLRQLENDLARLAHTLARLAHQHRGTPAVARTLTQQAMPTTLGMRIGGWLAGAHDAVRLARTHANLPVSLGGPVGSTAAYGERGPAVVDALAGELDLQSRVLPWHTRRTPVLGVATALAGVGEACGKIAADVLVMAQTEVGEVRESVEGPSSAMAHKANPAQSVLVASASRQLPGLLSTVVASGVAEMERPPGAWHAEWQALRSMLRLAGAAGTRTVALVEDLVMDTDAMASNLDRLLADSGHDASWVEQQTAHCGAWIDRVLAQHQELFE